MSGVKGFPRTVISTLISQVITKLNTGLSLLSGGTAVSSSNPLPTATGKGTSTSVEVQAGRMNIVRASKAAVAGEFARVQIHNAGTEVLQIPAIQTWAGSAGTHIYSVYEVETHDASAALSNVVTNCRLGNSPSADIEVYSRSSASAITTTGLFSQVSSALIAPAGIGLIFTGTQITIPAGKTIEIAIGTANVALNVVCAVNVI